MHTPTTVKQQSNDQKYDSHDTSSSIVIVGYCRMLHICSTGYQW
jgi:hypothetical protein